MDASTLLCQRQTLVEGLRDLAQMTARSLKAQRCSVMLVDEGNDETGPSLRVYSHWGDLPAAAYQHPAPLDQGIAGYVLRTRQPLLIEDIRRSEFSGIARQDPDASPCLLAAPIQIASEVIGVINLSGPLNRISFSARDLQLLEVFSLVVGQAIHVFQLQKLAESHLLQMAEILRQREAITRNGVHPISPDPGRLTKMVAKNFYRELSAAGFGPNDIISVASEVLAQLNENISKHRTRRERERSRSEPQGTAD
jgi:GAF domain-containing protein